MAVTKIATKSALDSLVPRAAATAVPRIIGASAGEPGTAKSHFWMGGPAPVVYFNLNKGLEGVADFYLEKGKDVRILDYDWEPTDELDQDEAAALRDQITKDFEAACQLVGHGTVVIDEYELWEIYRYAEFGGPSERPNNYSALNQRYRKLVNFPKKYTCNVGFVQTLKDEWVSFTATDGREKGKASGKRKLAGWKELNGLVNCELWHEREGGQFTVTVGKVRGSSVFGVTDSTHSVFGPKGETMFDFATLAQMIFPQSEPEDWA